MSDVLIAVASLDLKVPIFSFPYANEYITKGSHAQASVTTRILNKETNMANPSPVDSFFATFTGLKTILYRNIALLTVIIFPLAYQMIIVDFLSQEHKSGACNNTGKQFQMSI